MLWNVIIKKKKKNSKVEIQLFNGHTAKPALPDSGN